MTIADALAALKTYPVYCHKRCGMYLGNVKFEDLFKLDPVWICPLCEMAERDRHTTAEEAKERR